MEEKGNTINTNFIYVYFVIINLLLITHKKSIYRSCYCYSFLNKAMAMGGRIHKKNWSDESMVTLSSSQQSPLYYVQSPQSLDIEKLSSRSSSVDLTPNHYYHHSRAESSTSRYSTSWKKLDEKNDKNDDDDEVVHDSTRKYICCFFGFVLLFALVCFILWAVGRSFKPRVYLEVTFSMLS